MNIILGIIVFSIVLFLYLHIYFQLKTSNDLELYNVDVPSKEKFEEICDLKQPVLFKYLSINQDFKSLLRISELNKTYGNFDIKLIDSKKEINSITNLQDNDGPPYVPIKFSTAIDLFNKDKESKYYTEKNSEFIEEACITKHFRHNDGFLRPYMVSKCDYDIITGSSGIKTPLKYNITYRNFFIVMEGKVRVRLIPPKSHKYLYLIDDYENFNFYSPVNVWDPQDIYKSEFNKVKYLDIDVLPNNCLYIPPYWLYSISFYSNTLITSFKYRTYMNTLSNIPKYIMKFLQLQNTKHKLYNTNNYNNYINDNNNVLEVKNSEIKSNEVKNSEAKNSELKNSEVKNVEISSKNIEINNNDFTSISTLLNDNEKNKTTTDL